MEAVYNSHDVHVANYDRGNFYNTTDGMYVAYLVDNEDNEVRCCRTGTLLGYLSTHPTVPAGVLVDIVAKGTFGEVLNKSFRSENVDWYGGRVISYRIAGIAEGYCE